jgi:hypothetical protein
MAVPDLIRGLIRPSTRQMRERRSDIDRPAGNEAFHHCSFARRHFHLARPVDGRVKPGHDGFPLSVR